MKRSCKITPYRGGNISFTLTVPCFSEKLFIWKMILNEFLGGKVLGNLLKKVPFFAHFLLPYPTHTDRQKMSFPSFFSTQLVCIRCNYSPCQANFSLENSRLAWELEIAAASKLFRVFPKKFSGNGDTLLLMCLLRPPSKWCSLRVHEFFQK